MASGDDPNMTTASSESNSSHSGNESQQILYQNLSFGLSFITLFFAITGTLTNMISVFLYTRPTMRSSMNVLLAGLSGFDLCFSVLSIPTFVAPPMCIYHPQKMSFFCDMICYATLYIYPFTNVAKTGGIWTLVYITVQRWCTVRRPFRRARGSSISLAKRALICIFIASFLYNTPRFFEHQPDDEGAYGIAEYLRHDPIYMSMYYSIFYLLTHFVIPFTVLAFINGTMTCAIRRALKQHRMLSHSEKAAAMMATVVLVFVCCNTLPFIMNFVEFLGPDLWKREETRVCLWTLNDVSNILLLVNASSNAFIYYFCNQKYAQVLQRCVSDWKQSIGNRFKKSRDPQMPYRLATTATQRPGRWSMYAVYAANARSPRDLCEIDNDQQYQLMDDSPRCALYYDKRAKKRSNCVLEKHPRVRSGTMGRSRSSTVVTIACGSWNGQKLERNATESKLRNVIAQRSLSAIDIRSL